MCACVCVCVFVCVCVDPVANSDPPFGPVYIVSVMCM